MTLPLEKETPAASSSTRLRVLLLDGFEIRCGGAIIPVPESVQRLVSLLAMHDRSLRRVFVAGTLWPDSSEHRAAGNLRSTLWRLRRVRHRLVESLEGKLRISPGVEVDAVQLCDRATRLIMGTAEPEPVDVDRIARAGELLPDWYDDWLLVERERFRQLRLHALEVLCLRLAGRGMFALAVEAGLAAVAGEPLRESAHRCLIRAYMAERNVVEAMRQYERYRDLMRVELNIAPSSDMEVLIRDEIASNTRPITGERVGDDAVRANAMITLP